MGHWERFRSRSSVTRPDLLLLAVPVSFLGTFLLGRWIVGGRSLPLAVASLVCLSLLVDGLFVNPPSPGRTRSD